MEEKLAPNKFHPGTKITRPKVLVVDDEAGFREFMAYELEPRGYQVVTAADGEEAIQLAQRKDFDVVILDLTMPKRDGLSTLSALKAADPKLEVLMVTGYATLENAITSMKRSAFDFITKPFQIDELTKLIERALDKRRLSLKSEKLQSVLVIDDEPIVVMYLEDTLRAQGYHVESATSGNAGLVRLATGRPPEILLLDLMMSGTTGFDVLEAIHKDPRFKNMHVIVLTAKNLSPQETQYLEKHAQTIIQKGTRSLRQILEIMKNRLKSLEVSK